MEIKRDRYLQQLISYMWDGQVKVITGIRRCGKSYLLGALFRKYLLSEGVKEEQILSFALDLAKDIKYRNPLALAEYVRGIVENNDERFYLFVDEIQLSDEVPNPYNSDGRKLHNRLWNGGNGKGTVKLYRDGKLSDEVIWKNVGCEYGEYCNG